MRRRLAKLKDWQCRGLGGIEEDVRSRYLQKLNNPPSFLLRVLDDAYDERAFDGEKTKGKKRARTLDIEGELHTGMEEHN